MKGQYTHYLIISDDSARITTRYDWQTFTYKDVTKTGTRDVRVPLPSEDDLKVEIQAFMDEYGIVGEGTKADMMDAVYEWLMENPHPTTIESYEYTDQEIDVTTDHEATISDLVERHPQYFAKRVSPDGTEFVIKGDWTLDELNAMPVGIKKFTNEQVKEYISENWDYGEQL